jgi:histone H3/H4
MKLPKVDQSPELKFAFKSILLDVHPAMKLSSELASLLDTSLKKRLAALVDVAVQNAIQAQRKTLLLKDAEQALVGGINDIPDSLKEIHAFASLATAARSSDH